MLDYREVFYKKIWITSNLKTYIRTDAEELIQRVEFVGAWFESLQMKSESELIVHDRTDWRYGHELSVYIYVKLSIMKGRIVGLYFNVIDMVLSNKKWIKNI